MMNKNLNLSSLNKLSINYATLSNQKFSGPNLINYNNKIDESIYTNVETIDKKEKTITELKEIFLSYGKVDTVLIADIENLVLDLEANPNDFSTKLLENLHKIELTQIKYNVLEGSYADINTNTINLNYKGEFAQKTLIHEMGHALHTEFDNHKVPENYVDIAESARENMVGKEEDIFNLTNSYKENRIKIVNEIKDSLMHDSTFRVEAIESLPLNDLIAMEAILYEKFQNPDVSKLGFKGLITFSNQPIIKNYQPTFEKEIINSYVETAAFNRAKEETYQIMVSERAICDILASVLGGGFNCKLPNGQELNLIATHDENYFADIKHQYSEQVANYFTLKIYGNQQSLEELKYIMGDDWINMMESQMNAITTNMENSTTVTESMEKFITSNNLKESTIDYNNFMEIISSIRKEGDPNTIRILQNIHKINYINQNQLDNNPNGNAYYSLSEAVINFSYFNIPENYTNIIENANKTLTNNPEYHLSIINYIADMQTAQYKKNYNQYILSLNGIYESASKASFVNKEELHVTLENTHQASEYANKTAYNDNFNLIAVSEILNSVSSGESSENQYKEQLIYFCSLKLQNKEGDLNTLKYLLGNEWYQTMEIGMNNITISLEEYHGKY